MSGIDPRRSLSRREVGHCFPEHLLKWRHESSGADVNKSHEDRSNLSPAAPQASGSSDQLPNKQTIRRNLRPPRFHSPQQPIPPAATQKPPWRGTQREETRDTEQRLYSLEGQGPFFNQTEIRSSTTLGILKGDQHSFRTVKNSLCIMYAGWAHGLSCVYLYNEWMSGDMAFVAFLATPSCLFLGSRRTFILSALNAAFYKPLLFKELSIMHPRTRTETKWLTLSELKEKPSRKLGCSYPCLEGRATASPTVSSSRLSVSRPLKHL